ncbi:MULTISPECIES: zinc-dependent peptidase [Flavobacterium]|uniref:Zinc-dependent peptidase n=1 Tax=Flavobacterium hankyongi TaxID=1176532 RepID=A0ABP8ZVA7_9FLAO|nr:zinc-dependent peptidase [Flavobacterium sp. N1846]
MNQNQEQGVWIFIIFISVLFLIVFIYAFNFLEYLFAKYFYKPFYVHFYPLPKKLNDSHKKLISDNYSFYRKLSDRRKKYFEHRVAVFIQKYDFKGNGGLVITDEMKVLIASTSVKLTFGMRRFIYTVFDKIILYPDIYYSEMNDLYHKGEFNPRYKALVFSWKHFKEGLDVSNDNLNLGLHEFSHTLHFQCLKNSSVSNDIYVENYQKLVSDISKSNYKDKIRDSEYFREYAFTNELEFIAVILENFFETPDKFKNDFPELFLNVKRMINYRES